VGCDRRRTKESDARSCGLWGRRLPATEDSKLSERRIKLLGIEAEILRDQMTEYNRAQENLNRSATMVLAREGLRSAILNEIEGDELIVTVPSD
jgi:hypothetical protein